MALISSANFTDLDFYDDCDHDYVKKFSINILTSICLIHVSSFVKLDFDLLTNQDFQQRHLHP